MGGLRRTHLLDWTAQQPPLEGCCGEGFLSSSAPLERRDVTLCGDEGVPSDGEEQN